jgi:hypothetical protein
MGICCVEVAGLLVTIVSVIALPVATAGQVDSLGLEHVPDSPFEE